MSMKATLLRRLRRLRHPIAFARRILHLLRKQRSLERQIRVHIDGHQETAAVPQRPRMTFPASPDELKKADFFNMYWYYEAELLPGVFAKGMHPRDLPMLPRLMLRNSD